MSQSSLYHFHSIQDFMVLTVQMSLLVTRKWLFCDVQHKGYKAGRWLLQLSTAEGICFTTVSRTRRKVRSKYVVSAYIKKYIRAKDTWARSSHSSCHFLEQLQKSVSLSVPEDNKTYHYRAPTCGKTAHKHDAVLFPHAPYSPNLAHFDFSTKSK